MIKLSKICKEFKLNKIKCNDWGWLGEKEEQLNVGGGGPDYLIKRPEERQVEVPTKHSKLVFCF